jgi:hypothetical protein
MGVDGSRVYAVRSEPERRARMGHFVDRTGMAVSFLRLGDDRPAVTTGGPRGDRIDDVCRRAFGLDTSPPDMSITLLWASWWLERVLAAAASSATHVATWPRVARHHLAVREGSPAPTVEDLVEAGRDLEAMGSWEALRSIVAKGRRVVPAIDPAAARWMDDGMFSRWTMQDLPPLSQLREAVAVAVPGEVAAAVHAVLDAWGLP